MSRIEAGRRRGRAQSALPSRLPCFQRRSDLKAPPVRGAGRERTARPPMLANLRYHASGKVAAKTAGSTAFAIEPIMFPKSNIPHSRGLILLYPDSLKYR